MKKLKTINQIETFRKYELQTIAIRKNIEKSQSPATDISVKIQRNLQIGNQNTYQGTVRGMYNSLEFSTSKLDTAPKETLNDEVTIEQDEAPDQTGQNDISVPNVQLKDYVGSYQEQQKMNLHKRHAQSQDRISSMPNLEKMNEQE